jgi:hypothetical protein
MRTVAINLGPASVFPQRFSVPRPGANLITHRPHEQTLTWLSSNWPLSTLAVGPVAAAIRTERPGHRPVAWGFAVGSARR